MSELSHRIFLGSSDGLKKAKTIIIAVIAVAVIAVIAVAYTNISQNRREAEFKTTYNNGVDMFKKGNIPDAVMRLEKAVALNPNDDKAHLVLAQGYLSTGKVKDAEKEYLATLKINPKQPEALYNLGLVYKSKGDFKNALLSFQKAKELNKDLYPADIMAANAYREMGKADKAITLLNQLIKSKPFGADLSYIYVELGQAYAAKGKNDVAKLQYQQALKLDKNNVRAKQLLGVK